MKNYLDDLLVLTIIMGVFSPLYIALFKRRRWAIFGIGLLFILGSVPATIMSGLTIHGCCGGGGSKYDGIEYFIGAAVAICGIFISAYSKKLAKDK